MNKTNAIKVLQEWDRQGKYVFVKHDLQKLFPEDSEKALTESLTRLVNAGLLERACRGVYVNPNAQTQQSYLIEEVAKALRRGEYNYVSLESALSEYGAISQIPIDRLTLMTTGRRGLYKTPYGTIEFTHTKRKITDIIEHSVHIENRPLRVATKQAAWRDLKRVGRNINMVDLEELDD